MRRLWRSKDKLSRGDGANGATFVHLIFMSRTAELESSSLLPCPPVVKLDKTCAMHRALSLGYPMAQVVVQQTS